MKLYFSPPSHISRDEMISLLEKKKVLFGDLFDDDGTFVDIGLPVTLDGISKKLANQVQQHYAENTGFDLMIRHLETFCLDDVQKEYYYEYGRYQTYLLETNDEPIYWKEQDDVEIDRVKFVKYVLQKLNWLS
jgi:hypothetical protein